MALYELKPKQFKLLEILSNPDHVTKTVEEKCKLAKISRTTYYKYLHDEKFQVAIDKALNDILKAAVLPAARQMIKAATGKSFPDRKLLFEMAGAYNPKGTLELELPPIIKTKWGTHEPPPGD